MCSDRPHSSTSDRRASSAGSGVVGGIRRGTMSVVDRTLVTTSLRLATGQSYRPGEIPSSG